MVSNLRLEKLRSRKVRPRFIFSLFSGANQIWLVINKEMNTGTLPFSASDLICCPNGKIAVLMFSCEGVSYGTSKFKYVLEQVDLGINFLDLHPG